MASVVDPCHETASATELGLERMLRGGTGYPFHPQPSALAAPRSGPWREGAAAGGMEKGDAIDGRVCAAFRRRRTSRFRVRDAGRYPAPQELRGSVRCGTIGRARNARD